MPRCLLSTFAVRIYYEGRALKQMKLQLFSFPPVGPAPPPAVVLIYLMLDPSSLGTGLQPCDQPRRTPGRCKHPCLLRPWGTSKGPRHRAGRVWNKRGNEEAAFPGPRPRGLAPALPPPPLWRGASLIKIEPASHQHLLPSGSITHQIKLLLILRSWDAYKAGLLVHKDES